MCGLFLGLLERLATEAYQLQEDSMSKSWEVFKVP